MARTSPQRLSALPKTLRALRSDPRVRPGYHSNMTKVEALESDVQRLTAEELAAFRAWFVEYDWHVGDRQFEADAAAGKLDALAAEALAELDRGETTEL